jgi:hypothetical protein
MAAVYIASYRPAPPFIFTVGLANLSYLLFISGVIVGHFRIFHLQKRLHVLLTAVGVFALGHFSPIFLEHRYEPQKRVSFVLESPCVTSASPAPVFDLTAHFCSGNNNYYANTSTFPLSRTELREH